MNNIKSNNAIRIVRLEKIHPVSFYNDVALLHIKEIRFGTLPMLGERFLSRLYYQLAISPLTGVWVALENDHVVGFIAGCANVRRSYLSSLSKGAIPLLLAMRSSLTLNLAKRILGVLTYPFRNVLYSEPSIRSPNKVKTELLAIAVDPSYQRQGIGTLLITFFESALNDWNILAYYKVATNVTDKISNSFYRKLGFVPVGTMMHNNLTLQVYVKEPQR